MAAINKAIGGIPRPAGRCWNAVGRTAHEILDADRVQVLLGVDPRHMEVAHVSGLPHPELAGGPDARPRGSSRPGAMQLALEKRACSRSTTGPSDDRVNKDLADALAHGRRRMLLPLLARERTLGLLVVSTRQAAATGADEQVDVAEALAAQASVALENARLYEEARSAPTTS